MAVWKIFGKKLRRERTRAGLSIEQLAQKSGVGDRSIRRYEAADVSARKGQVDCLAKALGVDPRDLAKPLEEPRGARSTRELFDRHFPKRSELELRVAAEAEAFAARGATPKDDELTAKRLQDIFTVYRGYEGRCFVLEGVVDRQRGLSVGEAAKIGAKSGAAARFHVVKMVTPELPIGVTVYTKCVEDSLALQGAFERAVALEVRVVVTEIDDAWPGFAFFGGESKRPWMFVVERIVRA